MSRERIFFGTKENAALRSCSDQPPPRRCRDSPISRGRERQRERTFLFTLASSSREKLDIDRDRLALLFASTNGDLRQTLNLLQWTALKPSNGSEGEVEIAGKDVDLGAFDAVQKLMDPREKFTGKLDYYFVDTSMVPLLVQENYLASSATQSRFADLERFAAAADSISAGDLINQTIYAHSNWTLDEIHGMVSTVAPCVYASRSACVRLNFPGWLAKVRETKFPKSLFNLSPTVRQVRTHTTTRSLAYRNVGEHVLVHFSDAPGNSTRLLVVFETSHR